MRQICPTGWDVINLKTISFQLFNFFFFFSEAFGIHMRLKVSLKFNSFTCESDTTIGRCKVPHNNTIRTILKTEVSAIYDILMVYPSW